MSLYNMLFGRNSQTPILLAVLGLQEHDVERFRDVSVSSDGKTIFVYTRTGGNNREDYHNLTMRHLPSWKHSEDDDFDNTYCTDTFAVPAEFVSDVLGLSDILENGIRPEFGKHLAITLRREPTEADKETKAYAEESAALKATEHFMANGHTFVPKDDYAMEVALKLAEANGGKLRTCWGIAPIGIQIKQNFQKWPNAMHERDRGLTRVDVSYSSKWEMDVAYWEHCKKRFGATYPLTVAEIETKIESKLPKQSFAI